MRLADNSVELGSCVACNFNCSACINQPTYCTACKTSSNSADTSFFLDQNLNVCGINCPDGYFPNKNVCYESTAINCSNKSMFATCSDCFRFNNDGSCSVCKSQKFLDLTRTSCISKCPSGQVYLNSPNSHTGSCVLCTDNCAQCLGTGEHCITCNPGFTLSRPFEGVCRAECEQGYY